MRQAALLVPVWFLCSACLSEVGAKCINDSNCPSGQYCAGGACASGDAGAIGVSADAGGDAGPQAPLAGTVTLNGGFAEPTGNAAWVFAWDHSPALYDAGIETPQLSVQTGADGGFAFWDAGVGPTYYFGVEYSVDGTGVLGDSTNRFDLVLDPEQAGAAGSDSIALDAQTSACIVWSLFDGDSETTSIVALIADIPNVADGSELASSLVRSASATDPDENSYGLSQISGAGIPSELNGKYAYYPSIGTAPTAEQGNYHFDIEAQGYPKGSCDVPHQPLTVAPTITSIPDPWVSAIANSVSWTSAPGTEFDTLELDTVNSDGSEGPQQYAMSNVTSPAKIPIGACPMLSRCRVIVISTHTETQGFRAGSIAAAGSSDIVQGT